MSTATLRLQDDDGQTLGRQLLTQTALCLKLSSIHELSNAALEQPVAQWVAIVNEALRLRAAARLQTYGESVFFNNEIVKLNYASYESAQALRKVYARLEISEISFQAAVTGNHLRAFMQVFQQYYRSPTPGDIVNHKIPRIALRAITDGATSAAATDVGARDNLVRVYARLILVTSGCLNALESGRPPRLARLRRAAQSLAQASLGHDALLLALTRMEQSAGELATHLVSVAAMTLLMVRRLGGSRRLISECCVAALVHDVARGELDQNIDTTEMNALLAEQNHIAVEAMLRICRRNISPRALGLAATAYECTQASSHGHGNMLARLIAVPCAFDLMTSSGIGETRIRPDHAMRLLFTEAPGRFDENAVRLFARTLGLIPVGTTVRLSGGHIGIVMDTPDEISCYDRPRIKVIVDDRGEPTDFVMDLAELADSVHIVGSIDAYDAQLNVPHFLLG